MKSIVTKICSAYTLKSSSNSSNSSNSNKDKGRKS